LRHKEAICVFESPKCDKCVLPEPLGELQCSPNPLAAIGEGSYFYLLLREREEERQGRAEEGIRKER